MLLLRNVFSVADNVWALMEDICKRQKAESKQTNHPQNLTPKTGRAQPCLLLLEGWGSVGGTFPSPLSGSHPAPQTALACRKPLNITRAKSNAQAWLYHGVGWHFGVTNGIHLWVLCAHSHPKLLHRQLCPCPKPKA